MSDDFPVPGLRIATGDICDTDPFTDRITVGAIFAIILNDGVNRTRKLFERTRVLPLKTPPSIYSALYHVTVLYTRGF